MKGSFFILALTFLPVRIFAAEGVSDEAAFFSTERATLEEILNAKTSVSTLNPVPLRETPGLVTVITRDEIQASGARDLVDVLRMVPELEFGVDS
jgi:outer membrane receptor for ferrienterochelin and colicin